MADPADLLSDTMRGLGLLTRIPVRSRWFEGFDGRYDRAARAFPLVGGLIAMPVAAAVAACVGLGLSSTLAGLLGTLVLVVLAGALHEDGLADTADGLGGRTAEQRLAIMRDSAIGTYGVLALLFGIGIRTFALAQLFALPLSGLAATVAALAMARAAMVWLWWRTEPARPDGAAAASGRPTANAVRSATLLAGVLALPALLAIGPWPLVLATLLTLVIASTLRRYAARSLGGHTGDVLGACVVASECAILAALALGSPFPDMPVP